MKGHVFADVCFPQEWKPILGPEFVADRKSCGELQEIQVFGAGFLSGTDFCWAKWHRKWLSVWGKSIEESKNTVLKDVFFWWLVSTHDLIGSFSGLSLYLLLMYISTDLFYFKIYVLLHICPFIYWCNSYINVSLFRYSFIYVYKLNILYI